MDDFSAKPSVPHTFGVVGGDANAIAPGKRPLSSMTPTILTKDGQLAMVIGTPGGSRIFTSAFQVLADVYDFDLPVPEALAKLRFHHQLLPENTIFYEPYAPFDAVLSKAMADRGYKLSTQNFSGDIEAIQIVGSTPVPASDPRHRGRWWCADQRLSPLEFVQRLRTGRAQGSSPRPRSRPQALGSSRLRESTRMAA